MEAIDINIRNCNKDTGLYLKDTTIEEMITKFVLNLIFHRVVMSWIILPNNEMLYEIEENNHLSITYPSFINCMENCLEILFNIREQTYIISCVL